MQSFIHTVLFKGIETVTVSVQVHISNGLPAMASVGLADKAVAESKERVRAALSSLGLSLPAKRIAVNLAPADLVKEGAHFDLPIALGLMTAMGVLPADSVDEYLVLEELSLDGSIQPVTGTLPAALNAAAQKRRIICPSANGPEAGWAGELVAAMNPCRCGYLSDPARACTKAPDCARNYMARVSGPMLDRFDLLLDIEALEPMALMTDSPAETSDEVKARIAAARAFAVQMRPHTAMHLNAKLGASDIQKEIELNGHVQAVLTQAMERQKLSARGFHKILRVARTIADLARSEQIDRIHVLEVLSYRRYFLFGAVNG
ncbi:MAG: hypothetical protein CMN53_03205 [SAR116 cluster bacterium]|nr:hypothetical protein [SAR116 cluster bacterium]